MTHLRHGTIETTIGELTLVAHNHSLQALFFPDHWHLPDPSTFGKAIDGSTDEFFHAVKVELDEYLAGQRQHFTIDVQPQGNDFSQSVWAILQEIPYGVTSTYGEIAQSLGNRHLAQRVGQVVGRNPVSIIIPCHRVIGSDGSLTGYAGGLDRKRFLLELEEPAEVSESRLF